MGNYPVLPGKLMNRPNYDEKRGQIMYDDVATQTSHRGVPVDENYNRDTGWSANSFASFL